MDTCIYSALCLKHKLPTGLTDLDIFELDINDQSRSTQGTETGH